MNATTGHTNAENDADTGADDAVVVIDAGADADAKANTGATAYAVIGIDSDTMVNANTPTGCTNWTFNEQQPS